MTKPVVSGQGLRLVAMLAMLVVIMAGIKAASPIVVPFLLAIFLAIVLNPLVKLLEKIKIPRTLAIILLVTIIVLLMALLFSRLGSSLNEFARSLPQYRGMMLEKMRELQEFAMRFNIEFSVDDIMKHVDPSMAMNFVTRLLSHLSGAMASTFLLLMTVVFMLFEVERLPYKMQLMFDNPEQGNAILRRALNGVTHYLVIKTIISIATGIVIWLFLAAMGVRFAFLWGLLAFVLNYIPNIGSVLAAIPPIVQALLFNGFADAFAVTGGYILINLIGGNIIDPRMMGRGLGLSTLVVFLSLIFWGWLLGPIGMLLSVPLTIIVKIALELTPAGYKFAVLLSDGKPAKIESDTPVS
ncbi:AI-2E family transporter [Yersinia kristensenii]|uniref:Putative transport protein n=1 Tax=Yersinia kristensenii TaxID=28152 RepID=A0A0T9KU69_YERKR|nr:AI-2E family transporter [Yersinia kristensenii]MDA5521424.1 AI-2E family transporter [Yersinia kristensenii]MDR4895133.1 AI-2E family transporter [Yersinia kristensenii]MDX6736176.1 AI-2E family transporter [Yersinia kristensenii]PHZ35420.1 pheromone autoinducer 2 transporter [Yersinia kristensenii]CNE30090.1 putative transport protein [Yersinia kristensenii]